MKYLLDTDTCVRFLRGERLIVEKLRTVLQEDISVSVVTIAELVYGAYSSRKPDENLRRVEQFAGCVTLLEFDESIHGFGRIKSDLKKAGQLIPDFDILIASAAIKRNLCLVTGNIKHFERIPALNFENWLERNF